MQFSVQFDIEIRVELRKQSRNLSDIEEQGGNDGAAVQGNELSKYASVKEESYDKKELSAASFSFIFVFCFLCLALLVLLFFVCFFVFYGVVESLTMNEKSIFLKRRFTMNKNANFSKVLTLRTRRHQSSRVTYQVQSQIQQQQWKEGKLVQQLKYLNQV
ncbi:hypothetical protein JHK87_051134 [Glycine soja]|nr:hypothetical protein JHK87_051134 [Glycine soja]